MMDRQWWAIIVVLGFALLGLAAPLWGVLGMAGTVVFSFVCDVQDGRER